MIGPQHPEGAVWGEGSIALDAKFLVARGARE
jgi:hypothetical protein